MKKLRGQRLLDYVAGQRAIGHSLSEIAGQLGMKYKTLESYLYIARKARKAREASGDNQYDDSLFDIDFGDPWTLTGDWCVVGDVHVPYTDYDFAQLVGEVAKRYLKRPRKLLIAGDFFNMDAFSSYTQIVESPTWAQERNAGRQLLKEWLETFVEIRMTLGNHDRRMQRFTAGAFETDDILSLLISNPDRLRMSNYGWCIVNTPNGTWRVTHPKNYSVNQLTVADQLALKYQSHIISHHEHHAAIGMDRYKNFIIVNNGTLADWQKFAYVILDDSKSAGMAQSFTILRDGYPYVFGPWTDWSKWI